MTRHSTIQTACLCATIVIVATIITHAGSLTPPAGPVSDTTASLGYKTLAQLESRTPLTAATTPGDADSIFKITDAGSYYLTGNLNGVTGKHGIEVAAASVTIDLRGFLVQGVAGSLSGISVTGAGNVTIRDGTVSSWGQDGIDLHLSLFYRIFDVTVTANGGAGINGGAGGIIERCLASTNVNGISTGNNTIVESCHAYANTETGIVTAAGGIVRTCTALNNLGSGFSMDEGSLILGCVARGNSATGFNGGTIPGAESVVIESCSAIENNSVGILTGPNGTVRGCTASGNSLGIRVGSSSAVTGCTTKGNALRGIWASGDACSVSNCTAVQNGPGEEGFDRGGIVCYPYSTVSDCALSGNEPQGIRASNSVIRNCAISSSDDAISFPDSRVGISAGAGSTVQGCSLTDGVGITATHGTSIRNCTYFGDYIGIRVFNGSGCTVSGNTCRGRTAHSGTGIHLDSGRNNRLEGNTITNHEIGVDAFLEPDFIAIHNSFGQNTDNFINPNGIVGPSVTPADVADSHNPHSNYDPD